MPLVVFPVDANVNGSKLHRMLILLCCICGMTFLFAVLYFDLSPDHQLFGAANWMKDVCLIEKGNSMCMTPRQMFISSMINLIIFTLKTLVACARGNLSTLGIPLKAVVFSDDVDQAFMTNKAASPSHHSTDSSINHFEGAVHARRSISVSRSQVYSLLIDFPQAQQSFSYRPMDANSLTAQLLKEQDEGEYAFG